MTFLNEPTFHARKDGGIWKEPRLIRSALSVQRRFLVSQTCHSTSENHGSRSYSIGDLDPPLPARLGLERHFSPVGSELPRYRFNV